MKLNKRQRIAIWIGVALVCIMGLFPPVDPPGPVQRRGYQLILFAGDDIYFPRLKIQLITVGLLTGLAVAVLALIDEKHKKDD